MLYCMRTRLTLNADVVALLRQVQQSGGHSFEAVVNGALRHGLRQMTAPLGPPMRYRTPAVDLGRCLAGSLDDVAEVLAVAEDGSNR